MATMDLDDVRGVTLATMHGLGMSATFVGVPLLLARRAARGRPRLVVPTAIAISMVLTVATQRTAWGLVRLWLGIDDAGRARAAAAQSAGR